jgi:hypothetical protein
MGKTLELPDDVYEIAQREAAARNVDPAQFVCDLLRQAQRPSLNERMEKAGLIMNRPHAGPHARKLAPQPLKTLDGSLVSDVIIRERR